MQLIISIVVIKITILIKYSSIIYLHFMASQIDKLCFIFSQWEIYYSRTHAHTNTAEVFWNVLVLQLSDRRSSKSVLGRQSVAVAVDLVLVAFPPVPVSALLRGPRAVTDCGNTHLSSENEGEGSDEREREGEREHGMQRMASNLSSFHQAVSQSVSHSVHRGGDPLDWSRRVVSPTHSELFARWHVHN